MSAAALSTAGEPREQPPIDGGADGEAAADAHAERHSPRKEDGATALGSDGDAARDDRAECSETERERRTACGISHVCGVSSTTQVRGIPATLGGSRGGPEVNRHEDWGNYMDNHIACHVLCLYRGLFS